MRTIDASVVEFVRFFRIGDLHPKVEGRHFSPPSSEDGERAEQVAAGLLSSREEQISAVFNRHDIELKLNGRIDLVVDLSKEQATLVEVKATRCDPEQLAPEVLHGHWLQLKLYGYLWLLREGYVPRLRLVHVNVRTEASDSSDREASADTLSQLFEPLIDAFVHWHTLRLAHQRQKAVYLAQLKFPKSRFRVGQRELAAAYYRAFKHRDRVVAEVPTGAGKTLTALYPALKYMAETPDESFAYLTAKRSGSKVVVQALDFVASGALQVLHYHAREQLCSCTGGDCEFSQGFYDRWQLARESFWHTPKVWGIDELVEFAQAHQLCAHAVQRELLAWSDLIIADYNVLLNSGSLLSINRCSDHLMIDELHNLIPRARDSFSAQLIHSDLRELRTNWRGSQTYLARLVGEIITHAQAADQPEALTHSVSRLLAAIERKREKPPGLELDGIALSVFFQLVKWREVASLCDRRYRLIRQAEQTVFYCADPSENLRRIWSEYQSVIGFSATLTPMSFYAEVLGLTNAQLYQQPSPFSTEQLEVEFWVDVPGDFKRRDIGLELLAGRLAELCELQRTLIVVSSYTVARQLADRLGGVHLFSNHRTLHDQLAEWLPGETMVAPMGSGLTEGVDFEVGFLGTVVIWGMGMPSPDEFVREIASVYDDIGRDSFTYAYQFPGLNRVLQAAGRLIRSEQHRGRLILADHRWQNNQYKRWLPDWWFEVK
ncbi:MAG: PD-(D/E)XK nuclease family protein [Gammaproteobacteria bacterium]|nr:PD-(D/E)XK nuclease family protein [Gammaproteobacteria bacterium]